MRTIRRPSAAIRFVEAPCTAARALACDAAQAVLGHSQTAHSTTRAGRPAEAPLVLDGASLPDDVAIWDAYQFTLPDNSQLTVSEGAYGRIPSGGAWASRAAFALLRYLGREDLGGPSVPGRRVLELGAGSGVLSVGLLALGARRAVLTDGHYEGAGDEIFSDQCSDSSMHDRLEPPGCVPSLHDLARFQLQRNADAYRSMASAALVPLRWGNSADTAAAATLLDKVPDDSNGCHVSGADSNLTDLVVGADITYAGPGGRRDLLKSLELIMQHPRRPHALLAYECRYEEDLDHICDLASGFARCEVVHVEEALGGSCRGQGWDANNDLEVVRLSALC